MPDPAKTKLIVHIGAGKTGSSAIQTTLRENLSDLNAHGIKYLGPMLENTESPSSFGWHAVNGLPEFFRSKRAILSEQLYQVLKLELDSNTESGVETAIWCNESLLRQHRKVSPALKKLQDDGFCVEAICYIRRHDKWARSAYQQWGIKHKTYTGPLMGFRDWLETKNVEFHDDLEAWSEIVGGRLSVFNYDSIPNVAVHFMHKMNLPCNVSKRRNESETPEVTFLRAVFNNRFEEKKQKGDFDLVFKRLKLRERQRQYLPALDHLLPTDDDMEMVRQKVEEDKRAINRILESQNEDPIDETPFQIERSSIDQNVMNQILLRMIFELSDRLDMCESKLAEREAQREYIAK